jgi:hypothetical protein
MPVSSYAADALFVFRTIKYLATNPDRKWANTFEFQSVAGGSEDELLALGVALVEFEQAMYYNTVTFDRLIISTWAPDSKPYNPPAFITTSLTAAGSGTPDGNSLGLSNCLSVARMAPYGRFGHIFLRGHLSEASVSAPAGKTILTNRPGEQTQLDNALASSNLADYIGLGSTAPLRMVLVGKTTAAVRPVVQLNVQGVVQLPMDHAWFNRTTAPGP